MTGQAITAAAPIPLSAVGRCEYPALGVVAVMMGALISTLNARLTTQGLADIRGALGLGFDDGSWISTIFSAAQMVVSRRRHGWAPCSAPAACCCGLARSLH